MQPYEIMMSPADLYIAMEGEAFPAIDAVVGGNWVALGSNGKKNQSTAGVHVHHNQTVNKHKTAGSTGNVKAIRTAEESIINVVIEDLTLETYAKALNLAGIREVAAASGVAGYKSMGLHMGREVQTWSLLARFPSAYAGGMGAQYQCPKMIETASKDLVFDGEGAAAGLSLQYEALEDPNATSEEERFGTLVMQTSDALA
jgi:hypothetical protein